MNQNSVANEIGRSCERPVSSFVNKVSFNQSIFGLVDGRWAIILTEAKLRPLPLNSILSSITSNLRQLMTVN